jgi:hypothetical protein
MEVGGRVQASNTRLCGTVAGLQIEAFVLAFDMAALLYEVRGHCLKFAEPAVVNQLINADEAIAKVLFSLGLAQNFRRMLKNFFHGHFLILRLDSTCLGWCAQTAEQISPRTASKTLGEQSDNGASGGDTRQAKNQLHNHGHGVNLIRVVSC